jgi:hypothetical protein
MTGKTFDDWFKKDFCPEVDCYCRRQNIAYEALLMVDSAPIRLNLTSRRNREIFVSVFQHHRCLADDGTEGYLYI